MSTQSVVNLDRITKDRMCDKLNFPSHSHLEDTARLIHGLDNADADDEFERLIKFLIVFLFDLLTVLLKSF